MLINLEPKVWEPSPGKSLTANSLTFIQTQSNTVPKDIDYMIWFQVTHVYKAGLQSLSLQLGCWLHCLPTSHSICALLTHQPLHLCIAVRVHVLLCVYMYCCTCTGIAVRVHVLLCVYMYCCVCTCIAVRVHVLLYCTCIAVSVHVLLCSCSHINGRRQPSGFYPDLATLP